MSDKRKIEAGDIITLQHNKNSYNSEICAWKGHPSSLDKHKGTITLKDDDIILVVASTKHMPSVSISAYWLYCIHPVFGPITLDEVNALGYTTRDKTYKVTLHV